MNPGKQSSGNPSVEELIKENQSQREQLKKAQAEIERLRKALEEALRSLKRQAAPFSKGKSKTNPKRPGRKGGTDYGHRAFRAVPDRVDEEIAVRLPKKCPDCGGRVIHDTHSRSFKKTSFAGRLYGASMWRSATALGAVDMSRGATPYKLPMLWEQHGCKWDRRR